MQGRLSFFLFWGGEVKIGNQNFWGCLQHPQVHFGGVGSNHPFGRPWADAFVMGNLFFQRINKNLSGTYVRVLQQDLYTDTQPF